MFTHLLKLIFNQWKSNLWIMAELFISFVCICFVFTGLIRLFHDRFRDLGFDINHVYEVSIGLESKVSTSFDSDSDFHSLDIYPHSLKILFHIQCI